MEFDNIERTTVKGKVVYKRPKHLMTTADKNRMIGKVEDLKLKLKQIVDILIDWTNRTPLEEWSNSENSILIRELLYLVFNLYAQVLNKTPEFIDVFNKFLEILKNVGKPFTKDEIDKSFDAFIDFINNTHILPEWYLEFISWMYYELVYGDQLRINDVMEELNGKIAD